MPVCKSHSTKNTADAKTSAIKIASLGYLVFPLAPPTKLPRRGSRGLKDATSDIAQVEHWWSVDPPSNIGLRCDGLIVIDVDLLDKKSGSPKPNPWLTPERLRSLEIAPNQITWSGGRQFIFRQPAGKHYRNTTSALAPNVDTRGYGGYIVVPPSFVREGERSGYYEYTPGHKLNVRLEDLPEPPDWLIAELDGIEAGRGKAKEDHSEAEPHQQNDHAASTGTVERARAFIDKMPPAVEGQRGHDQTFNVACELYRFGLGDSDAAALLAEYNLRCLPPWTESQLAHKLKDAKEAVTAEGKVGCRNKGMKAANEPGLVKDLADAISNENHFAQDGSKRLYRFSGGVYRLGGDEFVKQQVKALTIEWRKTKYWGPKLAAHVAEYLRVDSRRLWDRPPLDLLNLQNGLLDVSSLELRPHDPSHLSPVQLAVVYDPEALCPAIEQFVGEVFPADANSLAWEIPAWLMLPNTSLQKSLMFTGPGGNGKSVYLSFLQAFLGMENVSSVSLHDLVGDKFAPAFLAGKLANICGDVSREELPDVSIFKKFTGGDPLTAQFKHGQLFQFLPFARFVFNANEIPKSKDTTPAYLDRWIIVPFPNKFRGGKNEIPRAVLDARLTDPRELSGLLNNALQCLPLSKFSQPKSVCEATQKWRASAGDRKALLKMFLAQSTREDPNLMVSKKGLLECYNSFAAAHGQPLATNVTFGRDLAELRPNVKSAQRTWKGKSKVEVYVGIGLR